MRRINGLMLALTLVTATGATAQQSGQPPQRGERQSMGRRGGPGDFIGAALRGIELTATQKEQIVALRQQYGPPGDALRGRAGRERGDSLGRGSRPQGPPRGDSARAGRRPFPPRGDSIQGVRRPGRGGFPMGVDTAEMRERRAQMEAQRDQMIEQVRRILNTSQRRQFDLNLQELQRQRQ